MAMAMATHPPSISVSAMIEAECGVY